MSDSGGIYILATAVIFIIAKKIFIRLRLSRAKHPSLRGHSKWSRRIARLVPYFEYDEKRFFCSDAAPESVANNRRAGMERLVLQARNQSPSSQSFCASLEDCISDADFTNTYRVPFPYRKHLDTELKYGSVATETSGVMIKDLDGNWRYDLSGSYGVNVFGYDFYKDCMEKGYEKVQKLGPLLGPYHPLIRENVEKLKAISGLDEVSFHMSGTEAVMQAVRLARYHTGKTHLVRLCGAYHGWWDGVQPGIGNLRKSDDIYTLQDISDMTLKVLETRKDIACILINPLQALHPNSDVASDATLLNSERQACFDRQKYSVWLKKIRDVCTRKNIVLIFDEVFTGFRLARRGAQEYFDIQADLVTYGKTLGGGLPVGVVCGRHHLMKRYKENAPVNVSFARGTFNSHPYVMASMNEFLKRIELPEIRKIYRESNALWDTRVSRLNSGLEQSGIPVRVVNIHSIWTILYTLPCRYNWMLQFYLRSEGLEISWVGSGRIIMSLNYSEKDFNEVTERFIKAARRMQEDGWWWQSRNFNDKTIKRWMLTDMFVARFPVLGNVLRSSVRASAEVKMKEVHEK
ncbi:MAG TPA: aminotransferase class III-fold pyridoxal phosphate-dependent enzyme [Gammaproteobacteria bacterium]|nr:aminotransferase class III-fold pyridoxal phosphate-dependent enzyme [Gammaproteobacteria bacterium]